MIHQAISKTEVAFRYYSTMTTGYSKATACKIFCAQERQGYINKKLVAKIIKDIFKEQKEMLKS